MCGLSTCKVMRVSRLAILARLAKLGASPPSTVNVGQAKRHQHPADRLAPPGKRRVTQRREVGPHRRIVGTQQEARVGIDETVVVLGMAGRSGVQDDVAAQRPVGQVVDDQRGMSLAHGPVVGRREAVVIEHHRVIALAGHGLGEVAGGGGESLGLRHLRREGRKDRPNGRRRHKAAIRTMRRQDASQRQRAHDMAAAHGGAGVCDE
jgi:hypothetical protein